MATDETREEFIDRMAAEGAERYRKVLDALAHYDETGELPSGVERFRA